ncbi:MAG: substrate-binding domain-containing protein [bacterium]
MKRVMRYVVAVGAVAACLAGGAVHGADAPAGRITISGAWALYPMVVKWSEEYRKINPGVRIDISAGGAGKGMADALGGAVDLGMVSRDVVQAEVKKGAWWIPVVKDAVVPTANAGNPLIAKLMARGVKRSEFAGMFRTNTVATWSQLTGDAKAVALHVYTRSDACGAAETWAKYLGCNQEDLEGTAVYGDPGLAEAVRSDTLAVGYNNIGFAYDQASKRPVKGIAVLPIDLNDDGRIGTNEDFYATMDEITRAIADGRYPAPPARDLNLVAKGCPANPAVVDFLRWILTDGQKYVAEAGYIGLTGEKLAGALEKIGGTR